MIHEQNLMDLYEAVYQLAVKDDYKAVCHGIVERLQANRGRRGRHRPLGGRVAGHRARFVVALAVST